MSDGGARVRVPGFSSRSGRVWAAGTAVAALAVVVVLAVTQPENRVYAVTAVSALALFFVVLLWQSTWLDPDAGTLLRVRCRVWRREVGLEPGTSVALLPNGGGTLLLRAKPARGRALLLPLVARTDHVEQSQPPSLLRALADTVVAHRAGGARPVAQALRAQADHLDAGGTVAASPLAALITSGVVTAAKAGGAGAVGGHLGG